MNGAADGVDRVNLLESDFIPSRSVEMRSMPLEFIALKLSLVNIARELMWRISQFVENGFSKVDIFTSSILHNMCTNEVSILFLLRIRRIH